MGQVNGYLKILVGLGLILGALGGYLESKELQEKHDAFCGGIMEALLDWNGNCEELRTYITTIEIISIIVGIIGILSVVSGNNEVENSKKTE